MSWCGGGEIRLTPGVECLVFAIQGYTFLAGRCPPSPGFAPWGHLDLDLGSADQIPAGHAKTGRWPPV